MGASRGMEREIAVKAEKERKNSLLFLRFFLIMGAITELCSWIWDKVERLHRETKMLGEIGAAASRV